TLLNRDCIHRHLANWPPLATLPCAHEFRPRKCRRQAAAVREGRLLHPAHRAGSQGDLSALDVTGHQTQLLRDAVGQARVQTMRGPDGDDARMQVTEESKVAYQIEQLVPGRLIGKAQRCQDAIFTDNHGGIEVTTQGKALPAKPLYLLQKPDGAGGRNLIFERVRIDVEFDPLVSERRMIAVVSKDTRYREPVVGQRDEL